MTANRIAVLLAAALCASCTHTVRTASTPYVYGRENQSKARQPKHVPESAVAEIMKRQIRGAVDAGDGDAHVRELRKRLEAAPDNLAARIELAEYYASSGYPELALEHYRLAAARFPDSADVALRVAKALRSLDLRGDAVQGLEAFLAAHDANTDLLTWLGLLKDETGDLKGAEANYRAALNLSPDSDLLHNNLGYNLLMQRRNDEAAAELRAALAIAPHSEVARNNLGVALAADPKQALLNWESVSDPATAHNNMAAVLMEQGKYAEARKELAEALRYNRYNPAVLQNLQLLSGLDGRPFELPASSPRSPWKRFASGFKKAFGGADQPRRDEAAVASK